MHLGRVVVVLPARSEVLWVCEEAVILLTGEVLVPGNIVLETGALAAVKAGDDGVAGVRVVDLPRAAAGGAPNEVLGLGHGGPQGQLLVSSKS